MDYTFLMFVFSAGFLIGSYFVYWHIESLITTTRDRIMDDVETLCSGVRAAIREEVDTIKQSLEKCKIECSKMKADMEYLRELMLGLSRSNEAKQTEYKPARRTTMKIKEKSSSGDGE